MKIAHATGITGAQQARGVVVVIAAALVAWLARRRIGGATGDVYGAATELCQLAVLVAFASHT